MFTSATAFRNTLFGLTNDFNIGRFDASVLLKGAAGFKAVNAKRMFHENWTYYARNNLFTSALNTQINDAPTFSSYYIEDGSYLKVDNVTVGYSFPLRSAYIKNGASVFYCRKPVNDNWFFGNGSRTADQFLST
jgi:hypothetical protein